MLMILRVSVLAALLCATFCAPALMAQTSETTAAPTDDENTVELLSQKAASFRRVIATLEEDVQKAETRLEDAHSKLQMVQNEHSELLNELETLRRDETDIIIKTEDSRKELQDLLAEVEKAKTASSEAKQTAEAELSDITAAFDTVLEQTKVATAELSDLTAARDTVLEQTKAAKQEHETLQTSLTHLQQTHDDLSSRVAENQATQQAADQLVQKAQTARDAALAEHETVKSDILAAKAERDAVAASAEVLRTQLNTLRDEKAETEAALNLLKAELQEAIAPTVAEPADEGAETGTANRRKVSLPPAQIARAIAAAPGLEQVSPQQRDELQRLLSSGVCTYDALETVFVTINRQTLVSLIRDLGRC